jgi:hypothetical protein
VSSQHQRTQDESRIRATPTYSHAWFTLNPLLKRRRRPIPEKAAICAEQRLVARDAHWYTFLDCLREWVRWDIVAYFDGTRTNVILCDKRCNGSESV